MMNKYLRRKIIILTCTLVALLLLITAGCVKSPENLREISNKKHVKTAPVNNNVQELKQSTDISTEKKLVSDKKNEKNRKKLIAAKAKLEKKKIHQQISILKDKLSTAEKNIRTNRNESLETANACLEELKKIKTADLVLNSKITVLKAEALNLLNKKKEALEIIKSSWEKILNADKVEQSRNHSLQSPLIKAYFLKGNIEYNLAHNSKIAENAKILYKSAIHSYYSIISRNDAKHCEYTLQAVKGFNKCRKELQNRFNIKTGFPPE